MYDFSPILIPVQQSKSMRMLPSFLLTDAFQQITVDYSEK